MLFRVMKLRMSRKVDLSKMVPSGLDGLVMSRPLTRMLASLARRKAASRAAPVILKWLELSQGTGTS